MGKKGGKKKAGIAEALPPAPVVRAPSPEAPPLELPAEEYLPREELLAESETLEEAVFRNEYSSRIRSRSPPPPTPSPQPRSPSPPPRKASPSPPPSPQPYRPPPPPVNGISSPALSALVDNNEEDPGYDTRAWARNIPFGLSPPAAGFSPRDSPANHTPSTAALGTSPSAPPFSLAGSPPATTDRPRPPPGEDIKGGFSGASPALSPRPAYRLPARQSVDNYSLSVSPRGRPMSMQQYPGAGPRPQAHLRGLSEAEIGMMPSRSASGKRESSPLTLFDQAYYDGHIGDVIINASGSALQILRLEREKLTILGTLGGLRGSVLTARMLPPSGEKNLEPIIALIVHGPMLMSDNFEGGDRDMDALAAKPVLSTTESQTTVEVYNLRSSRHLATLYRSPPVSLGSRASHSSLTNPASAVGSLALHVSGSFVTVTSGQSGEVYIFKGLNREGQHSFICLGKTWTSMPPGRSRSYSVSSTSSMSTVSHEDPAGTQHAPEVGIVSLSHRWLAVVPPPASSQTSLQGEVGVPGKTQREPPGLLSHTSPAQPSSNCEADTPLDEGLINKMARDAAQEAMKGAKRASEAGFQAFKNYWNKTDASPTEQANYNPYGGQASSFPPTHAQDNMQRPSPSVTLVSIIDLERLYEAHDNRPGMLVQPIATFPVRHGCSFLSFNPTGLSLFTSSAKGDVSYVWCLMRMIHGVVATPQGDVSQADNHASVRQIARYSRFTTSHIVDVIWTKPKGEKLAILTEKGTVHIHDLPVSAFRWPPPVRHTSPASTPGPGSETSSQQTARGRFSDAISFVQGTAQSFSTARLRSSLTGANFKDLATSAGVRGGRIVAAGISKSVGAASGTMSNIRHMGENRISLPGGRKARIVAGTVALLSSKYQDAITITGDGIIKLHAIRLSAADGGKSKRSIAGELISQISVPKLDDLAATIVGLDGSTARGQWIPDTAAQSIRPGQAHAQPLSFAEIETSTPHRPFHTDRHVSMHAFADDAKMGNDDISDDWIFGDDIDTYPLGEDQLPTASSHHGDRSERPGSNFEATFAFDEESAPGGHARSSGQSKPSAQKSARSVAPSMDNYDDLINIQQDIEAAGMSSELGSVRGRDGRAAHHDDDEEETILPFGGDSEFGL